MTTAGQIVAELTASESGLATKTGSRQLSSAEGYDRWAPIYDSSPNPLLAREERYLLPLLAHLRNRRVLDLACGTGRWLERLIVQAAVSGAGVDSSAAMLRVAGRKTAINGQLAQAVCKNLPFPDAFFDLAMCSFALGHISDLRSMVRELARVTTPGADVFISDLHPEAYARGWRVGFRDEAAAVEIETIPRSAEEIVSAFSAYGFECVAQESLWLGAPEKAIFELAGKLDSFIDTCQLRAVLVCHFMRLASPAIDQRSSPQMAETRP